MPVELIKTPLKACRIVGENVFSSVIEEDVNVPDANPDVYKILTPSAVVLLGNCETMNDKVLVSGRIQMNVLYAADLDGKPMESMDIGFDFSQAVEIPNVRPKMKETVTAVIQHVDCMLIHSRKLAIRIILDFNCRVEELFELELATDVRGLPDIQVLREPAKFVEAVGYKKDSFEIHEDLKLPPEKPDVAKVLKPVFRVNVKEERVLDGRVEVSGLLGIDILYQSPEPKDNIHRFEHEIPFTQAIEIPTVDKTMNSYTDLGLTAFSAAPVESLTGDRKGINIHTELGAAAKVFKDAQQDIVVDAYSPSASVSYQKELYNMNAYVGKGRSSMVVKDNISIQRGDPEIEQVCSMDVVPVINDVRIMDEKVSVEGVLEITAVYTTSFSGEPLCSLASQIPFKHLVEVGGAKLGMQASARCAVENLVFGPLNRDMIEFRLVLNISAEIIRSIEKRMINTIESAPEVPMDVNTMPAVTIYLVQKGDSLWGIAKRYHTTVDALCQLNQIENPSKITPGMQLLILKSIRMGLPMTAAR